MRIYFAASLRGGADFPVLASRIAFLERLGEVTTRHMAHPASADLGHANDAEIFEADQRLLGRSHVFIGDFSTPSTGAGFMAARAVAQGKPVLALFKTGQRPSAMLAGCPGVTTVTFADDAGFRAHVRAFLLAHRGDAKLRAPRIFLAGPPGSGKGTLGRALTDFLGAPHVSTGDLLRELVARRDGNPLAAQVDGFMKAGQLVPAELMRDVVLERLRAPDCETFGFVLDGYPPSRADLANLTAAGVTPDLVVMLECADDTAVKRQVARAARSTDTPEKANERLRVFHREAPEASWFQGSVVMRVDAERPITEVEATVLESVEALFADPRRSRSFMPVAPFRERDVRSTRVHFHVDAQNAEAVRDIAKGILAKHPAAQGQLKIYPIESLRLGPQVERLPIYAQLPNFHPISNADDEAFITGRLGDGDAALMRAVLEATAERGGMAEVEEYVGEWILETDGSVTVESLHAPLGLRFDDFPDQRCREIPTLELHLGFDVPRVNSALPLALETLMEKCAAAGLVNGGCFVFKKGDVAAYRLNEFASTSIEAATARLSDQARALSSILRAAGLTCAISFSLELVHGMWTFAAPTR